MKIHELNGGLNGNGKIGPNKRGQNIGFSQVLEQRLNGDRKVTPQGLARLLKDTSSFSANEIKREIDLVCDSETGEDIDMARLDELLKLYLDIKE